MKKRTEIIIMAFVLIISFSTLLYLIIGGVNGGEISECRKWEKQSKEFERYDERTQTGFYITKWQDEQCRANGIIINTEVLK